MPDTFRLGDLVTVRPEHCDADESPDTVYRVVTAPEGKGGVDISPVVWDGGPIVPMETVPESMLLPLPSSLPTGD